MVVDVLERRLGEQLLGLRRDVRQRGHHAHGVFAGDDEFGLNAEGVHAAAFREEALVVLVGVSVEILGRSGLDPLELIGDDRVPASHVPQDILDRPPVGVKRRILHAIGGDPVDQAAELVPTRPLDL